MSKKKAEKAGKANAKQASSTKFSGLVAPFLISLVITGTLCAAIVFTMSGSFDMGTVFTLASAICLGLCAKSGQVTKKTLVLISVLMGVCEGLFVGTFHVGHFFATHDGSLVALEQQGLDAIGLASGVAPLDTARRFLMHLFYTTKYGMVFNIGLAGIIDLFITVAFYAYFIVFMVRRLRD